MLAGNVYGVLVYGNVYVYVYGVVKKPSLAAWKAGLQNLALLPTLCVSMALSALVLVFVQWEWLECPPQVDASWMGTVYIPSPYDLHGLSSK